MLEKSFNKATKKHQKEMSAMKKKQAKEVASVIKTQCTSIEKAAKGKKYPNPEDIEKDEKIMKMVKDQTTQWTDVMMKIMKKLRYLQVSLKVRLTVKNLNLCLLQIY